MNFNNKSICTELWPTFNIKSSMRNFSYVTDVLLPEVNYIHCIVPLMTLIDHPINSDAINVTKILKNNGLN